LVVVFVALAACGHGVVAQAVEQAKPGPEIKELARWVGKWTYSGQSYANPFSPEAKFSGEVTRRWVLGGFFVEARWSDKDETGYFAEGIILTGYDPKVKKLIQYEFDNEGIVSRLPITIDGRSVIAPTTRTDRQGKTYHVRYTSRLSEDGTTDIGKMEYSADGGREWKTWYEPTYKKVSE